MCSYGTLQRLTPLRGLTAAISIGCRSKVAKQRTNVLYELITLGIGNWSSLTAPPRANIKSLMTIKTRLMVERVWPSHHARHSTTIPQADRSNDRLLYQAYNLWHHLSFSCLTFSGTGTWTGRYIIGYASTRPPKIAVNLTYKGIVIQQTHGNLRRLVFIRKKTVPGITYFPVFTMFVHDCKIRLEDIYEDSIHHIAAAVWQSGLRKSWNFAEYQLAMEKPQVAEHLQDRNSSIDVLYRATFNVRRMIQYI